MKKLLFNLILIVLLLNVASVNSESQEEENHSIILLIGDGMGWNQMFAGALVEYGSMTETIYSKLDNIVNITTENIDGDITDSAAAATAIATGVKTSNGKIGQNADARNAETILEHYESNDFLTGLITTVYVQHATPASFAAHNSDRANYLEIAHDMSDSGVDILLGGGASSTYFGNEIEGMRENGYSFVDNEADLMSSNSLPLLGVFKPGLMPEEEIRTSLEEDPKLSTMTEKALEMLDDEGKPFFLMIEGGMIDWGGHDNDFKKMVHETIEFEKTVKIVHEYISEHPNDLMIVTADHETGGLTNIEAPETFAGVLPATTDDIETLVAKRNNRSDEIACTWQTGGHSDQEVLLGTYGYKSELDNSYNHHIDTFSLMYDVFQDNDLITSGQGFLHYHNNTIIFVLAVAIFKISKRKR